MIEDRKISVELTAYLADASEQLAKLQCEFSHLRWHICWNVYPNAGTTELAKKHCRELLVSLNRVQLEMDQALMEAQEVKGKVIKIEDRKS